MRIIKRYFYKNAMIVFLIIAIAYLTYVNLSSIFRFKQNRFDFESIELKLNNKSRCYMPPLQDSIQYFSDILDDEYQPKPGKCQVISKLLQKFWFGFVHCVFNSPGKRVQLNQPLFGIQNVIFLYYSHHQLDCIKMKVHHR